MLFIMCDETLDVQSDQHAAQKGGGWAEMERHFSTSENNTYLGKDDRSLSRYSPSAFWIFPRRSASLSRDRCTPWMLRTSITSGDFDTFFISARNSVLILQSKPKPRSALCEQRQAAPPVWSPRAPGCRPHLWKRCVSTGSRCLMSALPVKMPSR